MAETGPAEILIYTYKEPGRLLSMVAHDLRIRVEDFELTRDGDAVRVVCDLRSLRAEGAMKSGRLDTRALRAKDLRSIDQNAMSQVLEVARYPKATFECTHVDGATDAEGELELHGRRHTITLRGRETAEGVVFRVDLEPSRWGIKPYRALGGTLRLQDRVTVEALIPS